MYGTLYSVQYNYQMCKYRTGTVNTKIKIEISCKQASLFIYQQEHERRQKTYLIALICISLEEMNLCFFCAKII